MLIWFIAACLQCIVLYVLCRCAQSVILQKVSPKAPEVLPSDMPTVGMIIPAAGSNPLMRQALASLLEQDYPHILPVIVTGSQEDPAYAVACSLKEHYPTLECLVAGEATQCGQKNHNTLQAIKKINDRADIYVFCDSSHLAKPNFIRELVWPIVSNEAGFTTGYHHVKTKDTQCVTLAYQISVLLMRVLQAVSVFTQPWGGAMAIARKVFEQHNIADFWKDNVVDDCSLASMLIQKRLHVQLCPHAILETEAKNHALHVWQAWMQRQVLFLKFCIISQWYLLGAFAALMALPVCFSCLYILGGLTNILPSSYGWAVIFACVHLGILSSIMLYWRTLLSQKVPAVAWLKAFFFSCGMFFKVYISTVKIWHIDWHGFRYHVAKGGKVRHLRKL